MLYGTVYGFEVSIYCYSHSQRLLRNAFSVVAFTPQTACYSLVSVEGSTETQVWQSMGDLTSATAALKVALKFLLALKVGEVANRSCQQKLLPVRLCFRNQQVPWY